MREIDKLFLQLFKNLKIVEDEYGGYVCYTTDNAVAISNKQVVAMVKQYQDLLIEDLLTRESK